MSVNMDATSVICVRISGWLSSGDGRMSWSIIRPKWTHLIQSHNKIGQADHLKRMSNAECAVKVLRPSLAWQVGQLYIFDRRRIIHNWHSQYLMANIYFIVKISV